MLSGVGECCSVDVDYRNIINLLLIGSKVEVMAALPEEPTSPLASRRRSSYGQQHRKGAASVARNMNTSHAGSLHTLMQSAIANSPESSSTLANLSAEIADPSSSSAAYLASLSTQSLESLKSQPELLHSSSQKLNDQLAALCQRHISSLVEVHQSSSSLPDAIASTSSDIDALLQTSLSKLAQVTNTFSQQIEKPLSVRRRARRLIEAHNTQLADLLNIPKLIITCIRSGFHTEALQLAAHISHLADHNSRLRGGPVLQTLRVESWKSLGSMRDTLLESLGQKGIRQSSAKRIISNLRRLRELDEQQLGTVIDSDVASGSKSIAPRLGFSEDDLCLAFLRARSNVLQQSVASPIEAQRAAGRHTSNANRPIAAAHLEAFIDVWRDGVQETVRMVPALFADAPSMRSLLSAFVHLCANFLRQELKKALPKLLETLTQVGSRDPGNLTSKQVSFVAEETASSLMTLHTQLSFVTSALSDLGLDIQFALRSSSDLNLEKASLHLLEDPLRWATASFHRQVPHDQSYHAPTSWLVKPSSAGRLIQSYATETTSTSQIEELAHFPPLAISLNNFLVGLNAYRSFAPISQRQCALEILDASLAQVCTTMLSYITHLPEQVSSKQQRYDLPSLVSDDPSITLSQQSTDHRAGQADRLLAAIALDLLRTVAIPYLRHGLHVEIYTHTKDTLPELTSQVFTDVDKWIAETRKEWIQGEESRRAEVVAQAEVKADAERQAKEEEEERKRQAEKQAREEEEERDRQAAAALKEEEERKEKERIAQREEQERQRVQAEEEERKRKQAEEEEQRRKQAEEEEQRRKEAEEEQRRKEVEQEQMRKEAEGEERRLKEAEEEEQRRKEAEEQKRKEAEEKARLQREAEEEEERKRQETQKEEQEEARRKAIEQEEEEAKRQGEKEEEKETRHREAAQQEETPRQEEEEARGQAEKEAEQEQIEKEESEGKVQAEQDQATAAKEREVENESQANNEQPSSQEDKFADSAPSSTSMTSQPASGTKKMSLAEKLKARQEERQRQAANAAPAAPATKKEAKP
ncbi:unnamed protein product [Sympodiomycopsis kandeliae]